MSKEKRKTYRTLLSNEFVNVHDVTNNMMASRNCQIADISENGIFIKTDKLPKPKSTCTIVFDLPGDLGNLTVGGTVKRVNWAAKKGELGYGVEFHKITSGQKKILDAFNVYLRNKQIINVSRRLVEDFFNKKPVK